MISGNARTTSVNAATNSSTGKPHPPQRRAQTVDGAGQVGDRRGRAEQDRHREHDDPERGEARPLEQAVQADRDAADVHVRLRRPR